MNLPELLTPDKRLDLQSLATGHSVICLASNTDSGDIDAMDDNMPFLGQFGINSIPNTDESSLLILVGGDAGKSRLYVGDFDNQAAMKVNTSYRGKPVAGYAQCTKATAIATCVTGEGTRPCRYLFPL